MCSIRVLHVLDKLSLNSGVCSIIMNYYNNMDNNDIIFDFMVHEDTPEYFEKLLSAKGSKIYKMPELKFKNLTKYMNALDSFFSTHKEYKIVHGHIANAAIFYLYSAKHHGVPIRIIHSHNSRGADKLKKRIRNYLLNLPIKFLANFYFACSNNAARFLYGKSFIKKNNIVILNNAINIEKFSFDVNKRNQLRSSMNLDNHYVIGHVGRFSGQKNHDFLIDIFNKIHLKNPNSLLFLIGDGELKNKVTDKISNIGLSKSVILMGIRDDVSDIMQAMDVFVLPSLFEGLPVVGIEAQAAGLPCIFSSSITKEAKVTENVEFINLYDSTETWCDKILSYKDAERFKHNEEIEVNGFNIKKEAKFLYDFYKQNSKHII